MREKYQLVTKLVLEGNRIGPAGVTYLANGSWSELTYINLGSTVVIKPITTSKTADLLL